MLIPINQTLSPFNNKIFQQSISDWWTIDLISPLVAYQPYGATSYANSLINLANPGTFDAGQFLTYNEPDWSALNGWEFNGNAILDSGLNFNLYEPYSFILKYSNLQVLPNLELEKAQTSINMGLLFIPVWSERMMMTLLLMDQ